MVESISQTTYRKHRRQYWELDLIKMKSSAEKGIQLRKQKDVGLKHSHIMCYV